MTNDDNDANANAAPEPPAVHIVEPIAIEDRINPEIDYTRKDKCVDVMVELITCPILRESSGNMIIFNSQCYGRESFDSHKSTEQARNHRRLESGYADTRLKCPRTGRNFDFDYGMNSLYYDTTVSYTHLTLPTMRTV